MKNRYQIVSVTGAFLDYADNAQACANLVFSLQRGDLVSIDTMPNTAYPFTRYRWETVGLVGTPYKTMQEAAQ